MTQIGEFADYVDYEKKIIPLRGTGLVRYRRVSEKCFRDRARIVTETAWGVAVSFETTGREFRYGGTAIKPE